MLSKIKNLISGTLGTARTSGEFFLVKNEFGTIEISAAAVKVMIERSANTIGGVREATATVEKVEGKIPIKVGVTLVINQGYALPDMSRETVKRINDDLKSMLQISYDVPIGIKVTEVTRAAEERRRRLK